MALHEKLCTRNYNLQGPGRKWKKEDFDFWVEFAVLGVS